MNQMEPGRDTHTQTMTIRVYWMAIRRTRTVQITRYAAVQHWRRALLTTRRTRQRRWRAACPTKVSIHIDTHCVCVCSALATVDRSLINEHTGQNATQHNSSLVGPGPRQHTHTGLQSPFSAANWYVLHNHKAPSGVSKLSSVNRPPHIDITTAAAATRHKPTNERLIGVPTISEWPDQDRRISALTD